jgi:hypothetical protein
VQHAVVYAHQIYVEQNLVAANAQAQGDFASARLCLLESLTLRQDLEQRFAMPQILEDLAGIAAAQDRHVRALTLAGAASAFRDKLGSPRTSGELERIEEWSHTSRLVLGDKASKAQTAGTAMTPDEAVAYALADDEAADNSAEQDRRPPRDGSITHPRDAAARVFD